MNTMAAALVKAKVVPSASVNPVSGPKEKRRQKKMFVPSFTAIVNGITVSAPTQDELVSLVTELTVVPVAPVAAPAVAKKAEDRLGHRVFSWLDKTSSTILVGTRDRMVVPVNIYLADNLVPNTLTHVSNGAAKAETFFSTLKSKSLAKAETLRPAVDSDAVAAAFQQKLANLVASNPDGAAMYAAAQQAK